MRNEDSACPLKHQAWQSSKSRSTFCWSLPLSTCLSALLFGTQSAPLLHLYGLTLGLTLYLRLTGEAFFASLCDYHLDPFTFIFSNAFNKIKCAMSLACFKLTFEFYSSGIDKKKCWAPSRESSSSIIGLRLLFQDYHSPFLLLDLRLAAACSQ